MNLPRRPLKPLPAALEPLPLLPKEMPAIGALPDGIIYRAPGDGLRGRYRRGDGDTIYADTWTATELRAIADHMDMTKHGSIGKGP